MSRALEGRRKIYKNAHPELVQTLGGLGNLLVRKECFTAAESLLSETLANSRTLFGNRRPYTGITLSHLAALHFHRGDLRQAAEVQNKAKEVFRQSVPEDHHLYCDAESLLGSYLAQTERRDEGIRLLQTGLECMQRTLAPTIQVLKLQKTDCDKVLSEAANDTSRCGIHTGLQTTSTQ